MPCKSYNTNIQILQLCLIYYMNIIIEPCQNMCQRCRTNKAEYFNVMGNMCENCWYEMTTPDIG